MKRTSSLIAVLAALFVPLFLSAPASAQTPKWVQAHLANGQLQWRSHRTGASLLQNGGIDVIGEYVDSLTFSRGAAGSVVAGVDTTSPVSVMNATPTGASSVLDSLSARLVIADAGSSGSTDSLNAFLQVSVDQRVWADVGAPLAMPALVAGGNTILGVSSAAVKMWTWVIPLANGAAGANTVTNNKISRWPYIRIILHNDISAVAVHNLKGFLIFGSSTGSATGFN